MADQETHSFFGENRSLFSDYYLRERLHMLGEWEQDISEPFSTALEIYRDKQSVLAGMNEAQTENEFVQPMLDQVLGFSYDVQKAEKKQGRTNIPDYILFSDEKSLKSAQQNRDSDRYYNNALALSDAKYWDRPLDSKGVADKDLYTNANPSFQIVNYLTVTGLEWGILTNGSRWRLYSTKARSRIDSYFEIDLKRILEEEDREQFRYFYHFFRRQAFQSDPETGQSFVERIFEGSIDYGTRLEKRLKGLIFDEVFLQLSKGFVHYRKEEEDIQQETQESLQEIYQGTLRLLYRLLFLLHAESRSLLPLDNKGYLQYSLMELKKDIANRIDQDLPQSSRSFDVWNDLDSLFHIIDRGDPDLNVPRYNGGLFRQDHPNNQFLTEHKISDKFLVPALEKLTRETEPNEVGHKPFIDYKSLNVEQLGSIYEGLLEFHLRQGDNENGKELYLENDKGERKATGSYYTPHYIVEYIVEHTLGPVFEERAETFKELMNDWLPKYKEFRELDQKIQEGDRSERTHNKRKEVDLEIRTLSKRATETLLNLKICDPAMGSGHFLKEATDKLAEKIITLLAEYPTNPVTNLLEDVRGQIMDSLKEQDIAIDAEEHLKDTNLIKRMVMKRSIYGVDLNPMAVELAKLSLWLDSFTVGAPLSFLDHHLKVGNSLIGTTVGEIRDQLETGQSHMFGGPFSGLLNATELMREVSVKTDATYSEVEQSIERYYDFEEAVAPYKKVLDIWLSRHFDNERAGDFLMTFSDQITNLLKGETVELGDKQQAIIDRAEVLTDEKYFFHWELEFPEVFVDLKQAKWLENPGFDAVVGNPPYSFGRDWEENLEKSYFNQNYQYVKYQLDLYQLFVEKSLNLIKEEGLNSFIVPDTWTIAVYSEKLRSHILEDLNLRQLISCSPEVFPEVTVDTVIYVIQNYKREQELIIKDYIQADEKPEIIQTLKQEKFLLNEGNKINFWVNEEVLNILEKVTNDSVELSTICETTRGINAYDKARGQSREVIDSRAYHASAKVSDDFYPELMGKDVGRYINKWSENHWIKYGPWLAAPREERFFKSDKLLVRKLLSNGRIVSLVDYDKFYVDQQLYIGILRDRHNNYDLNYLGAICNSSLINFIYLNKYREKDVAFPQLTVNAFDGFPIREVNFSKFDPDKNAQFPEQLEQQYEQYVGGASADELLELTEKLIDDEEEYRLPVIHDFLADLAGKMLEYNREKQRLEDALDPFKFLNKGVAFKSFSDVFADAIKYGEQLTEEVDIGTVHHDIEELRLRPDGDKWLLSAQLKHRDPETGWDDWVKEDEHTIHRTPHDIYRFELSDEEARYWQQAFEVLDEFENSGNFPGGKTRSTFEKLMKSEVPVFVESANIEPLIELREELAEVKDKIEKTDWLIDQVVYRLYGLSEEEIEVVEGSIGKEL
ncbi:Eco57I restriction-modification methylase domain-containing protein [Halalkalibaculum sp. DA384]|uniref:Eco57I restriction-modification methylase domain-containing protein n=1 Tax=Halalkalibaculum sp. DA384 TaxID=3373606 RepID=UPI003754CC54